MLIVGLTGGIASGKSTVAKLFTELGVPIIDADVIARELTLPNQQPFLQIVNHFKENLLLEDHTLDRGKLRQLIFANQHEREWLEALLHPLIYAEMKARLSHISTPYCIMVIPLLIETDFSAIVDRILVVDAPEEIQIARVISRDNVSPSHVKKILSAQTSRQQRIAKADDVIVNDKNVTDLEQQVVKLHHKYLAMTQNKRTF